MLTKNRFKDIEGGIRYALLPDQLQRLPAMWSVTPGIIAETSTLSEVDLAAFWHDFINNTEASLDSNNQNKG